MKAKDSRNACENQNACKIVDFAIRNEQPLKQSHNSLPFTQSLLLHCCTHKNSQRIASTARLTAVQIMLYYSLNVHFIILTSTTTFLTFPSTFTYSGYFFHVFRLASMFATCLVPFLFHFVTLVTHYSTYHKVPHHVFLSCHTYMSQAVLLPTKQHNTIS